MRVALVLSGPPPPKDRLALLDSCDRIVCADGGANAVVRSGRMPTQIVGDLDSIDGDVLAISKSRGVAIDRFSERKDETDGEIALQSALAHKPTQLLILGALGGRTAHTLGSLALLRRAHGAGVPTVLVGEHETLRLVGGGSVLALPPRIGTRFNVLAFEPSDVSVFGTDYDESALTLLPGSARGVSNVVRTSEARLTVKRGLVLLIVEDA
ncbi:MAG TPA: thiamine diphosphokinase [Burkholderiales bacterium]|nr:thiamine diphosphokinase [Burkholderiales bacterium]